VAKINRNTKTWALAGIFKRINLGEDPRLLRNEAIQLSKNVDPEDIAGAEQALIDKGYSGRVVQRLSATFTLMALQKSKDGNFTGRTAVIERLARMKIQWQQDDHCWHGTLKTAFPRFEAWRSDESVEDPWCLDMIKNPTARPIKVRYLQSLNAAREFAEGLLAEFDYVPD